MVARQAYKAFFFRRAREGRVEEALTELVLMGERWKVAQTNGLQRLRSAVTH